MRVIALVIAALLSTTSGEVRIHLTKTVFLAGDPIEIGCHVPKPGDHQWIEIGLADVALTRTSSVRRRPLSFSPHGTASTATPRARTARSGAARSPAPCQSRRSPSVA